MGMANERIVTQILCRVVTARCAIRLHDVVQMARTATNWQSLSRRFLLVQTPQRAITGKCIAKCAGPVGQCRKQGGLVMNPNIGVWLVIGFPVALLAVLWVFDKVSVRPE
jgi:hypothetical protein